MKSDQIKITYLRKGESYSAQCSGDGQGYKRMETEKAGFLIEDDEDSVYVPLRQMLDAWIDNAPHMPSALALMIRSIAKK